MSLSSKTDAIKGEITLEINGEFYVLPYGFSPSYYRNSDANGKPSGVTKMSQPFGLTVNEPKSDGGKGEDKLAKLAVAKDPKGFKATIEIPNNVQHGATEKVVFEDCYIISYNVSGDQASFSLVAGKVTGKDFKEVQSWSNVK